MIKLVTKKWIVLRREKFKLQTTKIVTGLERKPIIKKIIRGVIKLELERNIILGQLLL